MTARIDMTGMVIGRWTVGLYAGNRKWHAVCACGTTSAVDGASLRAKRSLGCFKCHPGIGNQRTHGGKRSRLYGIWSKMKSRCYRTSDAAYPRYGGRGIKVCSEWRNSFVAFRDWAWSNGYEAHLTIDRRDNDKGYEPDNCRWATKKQQNRNYSRVHFVEVHGKRVPLIDLAEKAGLKPYTVRQRIFRMGWSVERALTTPVPKRAVSFMVERRNIDEGSHG